MDLQLPSLRMCPGRPTRVWPPGDHWGNPWGPVPGDQGEMEEGLWVPGRQVLRSWVTVFLRAAVSRQSTEPVALFVQSAQLVIVPGLSPGPTGSMGHPQAGKEICSVVHSPKSHWGRKPGQGLHTAVEPT